ncbi:MAG: (2Fe-2S)-binding protein [Thermoleophilia bacterium]|nr:(2Fe-2S)-binding protein [Thermoleophilia bacterium]MDH5280778.1 (2Fe-2S)-binding protein [Thermoleophilia bacterium]
MRLEVQVNGGPVARDIEPQELLLDFLRDQLGLTGAKRSCDVQACGACTVLVDGRPVSSCCFLAADAEGREVLTVEGLAERTGFERLEDAFTRHAALQCGFCTPGMLLTVDALLKTGELTSAEEVKRSLAGNLCRCTGYRGILEAVCELAGVTT